MAARKPGSHLRVRPDIHPLNWPGCHATPRSKNPTTPPTSTSGQRVRKRKPSADTRPLERPRRLARHGGVPQGPPVEMPGEGGDNRTPQARPHLCPEQVRGPSAPALPPGTSRESTTAAGIDYCNAEVSGRALPVMAVLPPFVQSTHAVAVSACTRSETTATNKAQPYRATIH